MTLTLITADRIPVFWGELRATLLPAIDRSTSDTWLVLDSLMGGEYAVWRVSGPASGWIVASAGTPKGRKHKALWVLFAAGLVHGGPKARIATMREFLRQIEQIAIIAKCQEVRVETSRPWGRTVLADYSEIERRGSTRVFAKAV